MHESKPKTQDEKPNDYVQKKIDITQKLPLYKNIMCPGISNDQKWFEITHLGIISHTLNI
jgi:hypothetical protein